MRLQYILTLALQLSIFVWFDSKSILQKQLTSLNLTDVNRLSSFKNNNGNRQGETANSTINLDLYCKGDGQTDDTWGFQKAVNTGFNIISSPGKVYLLRTIVARSIGQTFDFTGCTLKLADYQTSGVILKLLGSDEIVKGGTFDGNRLKQNVDRRSMYGFAAICLDADYTEAINVTCINSAGIGIKSDGVANHIKTDSCTIKEFQLCGVFYDGSNTTALTGNIISNNIIDGTLVPGAEGIHLNSFGDVPSPKESQTTKFQTHWQITGNHVRVKNFPGTEGVSAICQRGKYGICSGNILFGGYFSITEGGSYTVIFNNRCIADSMSMNGVVSLAGIESHFNNNIIKNNYVEGFKYSIMSSYNQVSSNVTISNNTLKNWVTAAVYFNANTIDANRLELDNNIFIQEKFAVVTMYFQNNVKAIQIKGGVIKGMGEAAIVLDKTGGNIKLSAVQFEGYKTAILCYAANDQIFNQIYLSGITTDQLLSSNIKTAGKAILGLDCSEMNTYHQRKKRP